MDQPTFRQTVNLLSREHSLSILRGLRDGKWHLSSEVARGLDIHITTASTFLHRFAELGLVEHRPRDTRTFEYRLRSPRLRLEVDIADESAGLRESADFYVAYFTFLFDRINAFGAPGLRREVEHRFTADHQDLRRAVFEQMVEGMDGNPGRLRELVAAVHRDLWSVCSTGFGAGTAEGIFGSALRDTINTYPDLAVRCDLTRPLEL